MSTPRNLVFLSFLLLLQIFPPVGSQLSFRYKNFHANVTNNISTCFSDTSSICLLGDASVEESGALQLTDHHDTSRAALSFSLGRMFYSRPLHLWNNTTGAVTNFTTKFSFAISKGDDVACCGFAFFLAYQPTQILTKSVGSYLGLMSAWDMPSSSGNLSFVAVEFDTYKDEWDPNPHHFGIDVNSVRSVAYQSLPGEGLVGSITGDAYISYDAEKQNLSASLDYNGTTYTISHAVDFKALLPEWVSVGLSAATGFYGEFNQIFSWSFESTLQDGNERDVGGSLVRSSSSRAAKSQLYLKIVMAVEACLVLVLVLVLVLLALWICRNGRISHQPEWDANDASMNRELDMGGGGPRSFQFSKLAVATDQFREERKLGVGGFGTVYKGFLEELNREVAIKRISKDSRQGKKEFAAEVKIIGRLHHRNLVQLHGWCHERGEYLLVYELMPNGSLDRHIFREGAAGGFPWSQRYKTVLGVASAILYLHEECEHCVVHRDIKCSNIMLDEAFNAKLGDFGLARLANHGANLRTTNLAGTRPYMAPEVVMTGKASKESDVYSFGVVMLEITCGRRAMEARDDGIDSLFELLWDLYGKGRVVEAADHRILGMASDKREVEHVMMVGLWCSHPDISHRPSIRQAIAALNFDPRELESARRMPVPALGTPTAFDASLSPLGEEDLTPPYGR